LLLQWPFSILINCFSVIFIDVVNSLPDWHTYRFINSRFDLRIVGEEMEMGVLLSTDDLVK